MVGKIIRSILGSVKSIGLAVLILLTLSASVQAGSWLEAKTIVLDNNSNVNVTFLGSDAGYNNMFGLFEPTYVELFMGHGPINNVEVNLGNFAQGTELVFFMKNPVGFFKTGPAWRNPDNIVHAAITELGPQSWAIGFEDLPGGGDLDYNDIMVKVEGNLYVIQPNPIKPDLIILQGDLSFNNSNPSPGDIVEINATIRNFGKSISSNVIVVFYDGNPDTDGQLIATKTINGINKEEKISKTIKWDTAGKIGIHKIYVRIDPSNLIDEFLEDNNDVSRNINIDNTPVSIKILSPNTFSNWQIGSSQTIEWIYTGSAANYVKIELRKVEFSGSTSIATIEEKAPIGNYGKGSYLWNIVPPTGVDYTPGGSYEIRITTEDGSATDTSGQFIFSELPKTTLPGVISGINANPEAPVYGGSYDGYAVALSLYNPNDIAKDYVIGLKNDAVDEKDLSKGWKTICVNPENPGAPISRTLQAKETSVLSFACKSNWDWIPAGEAGFDKLIVGVSKPLIQDKIEKSIGENTLILPYFFLEDVIKEGSILDGMKTSYSFPVKLDSSSTPGIIIDPNAKIDVGVSFFKHFFLTASIINIIGSDSASFIMKFADTLGPEIKAGFLLLDLTTATNAWFEYKLAYDPDFNYTAVQEPIPLDLPELDAMPDGDVKKFALAYADVASLRKAIFIAYVRADGARIDNQSDYRLMQLAAANNFTLQSIEKMSEARKYYKLITASVGPMTDEEIEKAKEEIRTNGLPQAEIDMFNRNGMGFIIESKTQAMLNASPEFIRNPKNFTKFMDIGLGFLAYEDKEYVSQIVTIRVEHKGYTNTTASDANIANLDNLKSQINQSINQGIAIPETKALIDEMVGKSREVLDGTNNLAYLPYYEFAVNALAVLPALDDTPPEITISSPANGTSYILNQTVLANWQAFDPGSGIDVAAATVSNGTAINTAIVGTKNFSVNALDNSGNQASKTVTYNVVYNFSGVLSPIKDNKKGFNLGSTIPVKFQLWDANGNRIRRAVARIYLTNITGGNSGTEINGTSSGKSNQGNQFRYDEKYIFNLATKTLTAGTWQIRIELDDGTNKYATINLKNQKDKDEKEKEDKKDKKDKDEDDD